MVRNLTLLVLDKHPLPILVSQTLLMESFLLLTKESLVGLKPFSLFLWLCSPFEQFLCCCLHKVVDIYSVYLLLKEALLEALKRKKLVPFHTEPEPDI